MSFLKPGNRSFPTRNQLQTKAAILTAKMRAQEKRFERTVMALIPFDDPDEALENAGASISCEKERHRLHAWP